MSEVSYLNEVDNKVTIWRYMDFAKMIDILENNNLYLPGIHRFEDKYEGIHRFEDKYEGIHRFEDKYEGIHNSIDNDDYYSLSDDNGIIRVDKEYRFFNDENNDKVRKWLEEKNNEIVNSVGVSCWHLSEYESHAMWKIFLESNMGLAIITTVESLINSLEFDDKTTKVWVGKVNYIDYSMQKIPLNNLMNPLFYKNVYFSHEREFRLLASRITGNLDESGWEELCPIEDGIKLNIDSKKLIKEVVVSPYAPEWFYELIKKVLQEKYYIKVPIKWSIIGLNQ